MIVVAYSICSRLCCYTVSFLTISIVCLSGRTICCCLLLAFCKHWVIDIHYSISIMSWVFQIKLSWTNVIPAFSENGIHSFFLFPIVIFQPKQIFTCFFYAVLLLVLLFRAFLPVRNFVPLSSMIQTHSCSCGSIFHYSILNKYIYIY